MSKIGEIFRAVAAFIRNLEKKLPKEVRHAAEVAADITGKALKIIEAPGVSDFTHIIPELGGVVDAVKSILHMLEDALKLVADHDMRQGLQLKAASLITAAIHGNELDQNEYDLAAQAVISRSKIA